MFIIYNIVKFNKFMFLTIVHLTFYYKQILDTVGKFTYFKACAPPPRYAPVRGRSGSEAET